MILLAIALSIHPQFAVNGKPQVSEAQIVPSWSRTPETKPLTCGEHQHVDHWPGNCGPSPCDSSGGCSGVCYPPPPDKCVDDMHEVTEKEWLDLMDRLDAISELLLRVDKRTHDATR